ncbi:MAG TPA: TonB-dependent receptor [Thermoanaerobaculia bacterium]|nr:TonB-dependent receptor [Thermoanaerobaculia bacterium]
MTSTGSDSFRTARRLAVCSRPLAVALLLTATAWPAFAQETPPPTGDQGTKTAKTDEDKAKTAKPPEEKVPVVNEEITVTARHREETLQDVPFSVAAPTEDVLRSRGADGLEGVAANVAGFTVQNLGPGQSQVAMRGVSSGQIVRDQPGVKEQVGIYLDETPISLSLFTPDIDLFDVSRVEVLRGPQGTLFGAGSEAGTVRYITNQPELGATRWVGDFSAYGTSGGDPGGTAKVAVNTPVGTTAASRFAAYYTRYGGFIDAVQPNLSVKDGVNGGDRAGARWAFKIQPDETFSITPRVLYQEVKMDGFNRADAYNILANPFTTTRPAVTLGPYQQFTQIGEPFTDKFWLGDVNLRYNFGNMSLTSVTSYTHRDILQVRDAGALTASITGGSIGLPQNVYTLNAPLDDATKANQFTQELRLSGKTKSFTWLGGLFYTHLTRHYGQNLLVDGFQQLTGIPTQGIDAPENVLFFSDLRYKLEQFAVFSEVTWNATDRLELTGGLRYYHFKEDRSQVFDGIFAQNNTGTALVSQPGNVSADGVAPRIMASFAVDKDTKLNSQVSKGFRLGGINDPLNVPLCTPSDLRTFGGHPTWKDETLWNYEVGSKSEIMGGHGSFNVAAYYMDIKDLQATVTAGSCSSRVVFNVPKAQSPGLEAELTAAPNKNFDFAVSASYNDSKLESTLTSTDANGNVSVVSGIKKGNRLPTVPQFQSVAAATAQQQVSANWLGYATATYQYIGSRYTQIGDQAEGFGTVNLLSFAQSGGQTIGGPLTQSTFTFNPKLPAYQIVNLRVGILNEHWDVAIYSNNLNNERALLALDQERGTLARVGFLVNQPRTFGVNARVKF